MAIGSLRKSGPILSRERACADPEGFVRRGPNLITFILVVEGIEDPNITINGPSSARQRNVI